MQIRPITILFGLLFIAPALAQSPPVPLDQAVNSSATAITRNTAALVEYIYRAAAQADAAQATIKDLTKQIADLTAENAKLKPPVAATPAVPAPPPAEGRAP